MEKEEEKLKERGAWGGKREGAGRKAVGGSPVTFKAPDDVWQWLKDKKNRSSYIVEALREKRIRENEG